MNKRILGFFIGSVLGTTFTPVVNAATVPVTSNITGLQLWYGTENLMANQGYFSNLKFGGTATDTDNDHFVDSADLTFTGRVGFVTSDLNFRIDFDLQHGGFQPNRGIVFTAGTMQVDVQTTGGWFPYSTIDVATTNLPFLAGQPGQMTSYRPPVPQVTAGIVRNALPGLWDGQIGSAGFNREASVIDLLGLRVGMYLEGSITPTDDLEPGMRFGPSEVPIPAAVWLFGSGLAGLAGARGLRRQKA